MISVVLCTYNGEKYIKKQIDSILTQSLGPDEIIICDDNSTDHTCDLIKRYDDKRIKLYRNKTNLGVTANFENGLKYCKGDYIFLSDQDDVWDKNKVEQIVAILDSNKGVNLVFTDADLIDENDMQIGKTLWDSIGFNQEKNFKNELVGFLGKRYVTGATVAIKRNLLEVAIPIPEGWIHDAWLAICASLSSGIYCYDYKSIAYRQHSDNVIGCKKKSIVEKIKERVSGLSVRRDEYNMLRRFETFYERFEEQLSYEEKKEVISCIEFWKAVNRIHDQSIVAGVITIIINTFNGGYRKYYTGLNAAVGDLIMLIGKEDRDA